MATSRLLKQRLAGKVTNKTLTLDEKFLDFAKNKHQNLDVQKKFRRATLIISALGKKFTTDISTAEYVNFDENVPVPEPMINEFEIDWQQRVREDSINAIQEIASDQVKEISDDDGSNDENDELKQESTSFKEIIKMLDKMYVCMYVCM